jgi:hypothetical protein
MMSLTPVREARSLPTLLLVLFCLFVGIPATAALTPDQEITVAGQHLTVGVRDPSLSLSGPAQLVQIGNTAYDIPAVQVYGPLRPQLALGPVQRNAAATAVFDSKTNATAVSTAIATITKGYLRWYGCASLILLGFTAAAVAGACFLRMLFRLRRLSRGQAEPVPLAQLWRHTSRQLWGMVIVAVVVTSLGWAAAGGSAAYGVANGLPGVHSLSDLVGTSYLSPSPAGKTVHGYSGAVIGDSRAVRLGGPAVADATPDDVACGRSADSLAAQIGGLTGQNWLNLACSGASIRQGLSGPQTQGGQVLAAQVGRLKQVKGLRSVAVVIGPNDVYWGDFLRYCYGVADCQDRLSEGEFGYRLTAFDSDYGNLLQDLNDLPGHPKIIITTSYGVFTPDADCADSHGPAGAHPLSPGDIRRLADMNQQLNEVLTSGAEKYGFAVAEPQLTPLCTPTQPGLGPDLQGLADANPFHPTAVGELKMAAAVVPFLGSNPTNG